MLVRVLEVIHYPRGGVTSGSQRQTRWEAFEIRDPQWSSVEEAVRRLDRDVYPYLWLHIVEPVTGEEPQHGLNIIGGKGEYALMVSLPTVNLYYYDDNRSDRVVRIWESDQGSLQEEKYLCSDLDRVLTIARHFSKTGEAYPGAKWVE